MDEATEQAATETATEGGATVEKTAEEEPANSTNTAALYSVMCGTWSNNTDPGIYMVLAEKLGTYDDHKGYGYLTAYNEYFEPDFTLVFKSLEPDGDQIKVYYDKMESYCTGDPDDLGNEDAGEWVEEKVGTGTLTLIPQSGKVKIDSKEKRIKNKILSKSR